MTQIARELGVPPRSRKWSMESILLGLAGVAMIATSGVHRLTFTQETVLLVVYLGGAYGITRIPFPDRIAGRQIPLWTFPLFSGLISGVMDSFLVLLLVGSAIVVGSKADTIRFRAYNMIAALIGGLIMYFGEVYMLPLALRYNMREWYSMLPVLPPVLVFLGILGYLTNRLPITVRSVESLDEPRDMTPPVLVRHYLEFAGSILLLLTVHNVLLCLGVLFLYACVFREGEDLIGVFKAETEVSVMLLLVIALAIAEPVAPFMSHFQGWWAFIPATINGVLTGAIYPVSGDVWKEVLILSTAVLITPISSLVGVMLFKSLSEWGAYCRIAVKLAIVWFLIAGAWFYGPWCWVDDYFYAVFVRPAIVESTAHSHTATPQ